MAENTLFRFSGKVLFFATSAVRIGTYSQWLEPKVPNEAKNAQKWPKMAILAIFGHFWHLGG